MAYFEWENKYSVGHTLMDSHHQKLFDIINRLHEAMLQGQGGSIAQDIIKELIDYTRYHFGEEEKMLADVNYPKLSMHKDLHQKFISDLHEIEHNVTKGVEFLTAIKLLRSTQSWLQDHIMEVDAGYSDLVKNYS